MSRTKRTLRRALRANIAAFGVVACGLLAKGADGQTMAVRFAVKNSAVITALQQKQLPVSGVQVTISAPITALVAEPRLIVRSLTMSDKHSARLLLECRNATECLPFYASASWPADVDVQSLHVAVARGADASGESGNRSSTADVISLRAGSPATLLLDGERVHVMLRVVCLESGDPGDKVRVTTSDRRQQYVADVVSPGVLKGTF